MSEQPIVTDWIFLEAGDVPGLEPGWYRLVDELDQPLAFVDAPRDPPYPDDFVAQLAAETERLHDAGWFDAA